MNDYSQVCVYSPRRNGEPFKVTVTLNRMHGGAQATRAVRINDKRTDKATAQKITDTLLAARLLEPASAERWVATVDIQPRPVAGERGWELALVLADRIGRGAGGTFFADEQARVFAYGYSDDWELGRLAAISEAEAVLLRDWLRAELGAHDRALIGIAGGNTALENLDKALPGRVQTIGHLGAVLGRPDAADSVRRYRVAFPTVGGETCLEWVEVSVRPRSEAERQLDVDTEPATLLGLAELELSRRIHQVLESSRLWDGDDARRWQTSVRFSRPVNDNSWQLALVLADRIARGREIAPRGRLIATGKTAHGETDWKQGEIGGVGLVERKLELLLGEGLGRGDRVLIPGVPDGEDADTPLLERLRERDVSVAAVRRLRVGT